MAQKRVSNAPNFGGHSSAEEGAPSAQEFAETQKRLKKRELECQALWDTLKDMKQSGSNSFDVGAMWNLLEKRALNSKAARKLEIQV